MVNNLLQLIDLYGIKVRYLVDEEAPFTSDIPLLPPYKINIEFTSKSVIFDLNVVTF